MTHTTHTGYEVIKSLSDLPPLTPKAFHISVNTRYDFIPDFKAICVGFNIHNHTGATFNYSINGENGLELKADPEIMDNVQVYSLELTGVTDADILLKLAPIAWLKRYNALGIK